MKRSRKIEIEIADNGYVIREDDVPFKTDVIEIGDDKTSAQGMMELANILAEYLGVRGSRYDEERFYAIVAPGDKHDGFTTDHYNVIWGVDDEEKEIESKGIGSTTETQDGEPET
jgi:hypothetical protein